MEAKGREHVAQSAFAFAPSDCNHRDYPFAGAAAQTDLQALRNFTEQYDYDPVGNFNRMIHQASGGDWTRAYTYAEPSQTESGKKNNRLSQTAIASRIETYLYDAHGSMTQMSHLPTMAWDFKDQLRKSARQVTNSCPSETTYYIYDAAGQRARKVTERQNGMRKCERFYLGGFEIYREFRATGGVALERETLHVMDDKQRIALVETKTIDGGSVVSRPTPEHRIQFGNHLGSASLELDKAAGLISYEEYSPYGGTAFQAGRTAAELSLKRYRYTGKERDEENGFTYHGARYYAPWLGRWSAADPLGITIDVNVSTYSNQNPIRFKDEKGLAPEDEADPKEASLAAVESIRSMLDEHLKALSEGEPSAYGGSEYNYKGTTPPQNTVNCITFPEKSLSAYVNYNAQYYDNWKQRETGHLGPVSTLINSVNNLSKANNIKQQYNNIMDNFRKSDLRGTALLRDLHDITGWKTVYVSTSQEQQIFETPTQVAKKGTYPALKRKNIDKVPVDVLIPNVDVVVKNYSRIKLRKAATYNLGVARYNLEQLKNVAFGIGVTESGRHTFVFSYGKSYEVHWKKGPKDPELFEVRDLVGKNKAFLTGGKQSLVIAIPDTLLKHDNIHFK